MKRIRTAHEAKLRHLLEPLRPRKMEKALAWFTVRAEEMSGKEGILLSVAYHRVLEMVRRRLKILYPHRVAIFQHSDPIFWCDAGLGGLSRWLRAAGYEAWWEYGIEDAELLRRAGRLRAVVLTTDSGMMERGVLRDSHLRSLWLPPALHIPEQVAAVFAEFGLERRPSRCVACGGKLLEIRKEAFRDRIPPRTYLWLDQFWRCERCDKLFWNGTHWRKIQVELDHICQLPSVPLSPPEELSPTARF